MNARTHVALLAAVALAPQALALSTAGTADELSGIEVHPSERGGTVVLRGSHPPVFSVFRLSGPDRIIVDLAGADVSKAKAPDHAGIQGIGEISAIQFQKGDTRVGRVVLNADPALNYDVKVVGNDVVVALSGADHGPTEPSAAAASPSPAPEMKLAAPAPSAPESADEHLLERIVDKGRGHHTGHHVLSATSGDQSELALRILTDGSIGDVTVLRLKGPSRIAVDLVGFDAKGANGRAGGPTTAVRFGKTANGTRIVFDFEGETPEVACHRTASGLSIAAKVNAAAPVAVATLSATPAKPEVAAPQAAKTQPVPASPVQGKVAAASIVISAAQTPSAIATSSPTPSAPVVAKAASPTPEPQPPPVKLAAVPAKAAPPVEVQLSEAKPVQALAQASTVRLAPVVPSAASPVASVPPDASTAVAKRQKSAKSSGIDVRDLRVTGDSAVQEVVVELPSDAKLGQPRSVDKNGYELQLHGASVPEKLRRTLDATAFAGPIVTVSSFNVGQSEGRVVVSAAAGTRQELKQDGSTVTWRFFKPVEAASEVSIDTAKVASMQTEQAEPQVAGFTTAAVETANELPKRTHYTGRRISLEFKDIDIQNLLRLFADISHKNVVVADNVKGKVTIALRNVPWDQAFDLILKTHGLGKEESGNIVRVAPEEELEKERKAAVDAKKAHDLLEPLRVRLIPVNYALAGEVSDKIKDVLSERGVVTVDSRTNVLIVKDVAENLAKAEGMVRNLDTQTPQVLIEARIVEASTQFNREVGIQWGGNGGFAPVNANSTGLVFPSTATVAGAAGGTPNTGTAASPNFAVNLPAAIKKKTKLKNKKSIVN
jgi:type IV pilus assembly protein PilQ